jgi:murein DD-endopeptidase MepM/ murein hydrolase activator NlpD
MVMYMNKYQNVILIRHGHYITVYAGLSSVSVAKGDKVKTGQALGTIFTDPEDRGSTILHFEVRHEREKLNPLDWVK